MKTYISLWYFCKVCAILKSTFSVSVLPIWRRWACPFHQLDRFLRTWWASPPWSGSSCVVKWWSSGRHWTARLSYSRHNNISVIISFRLIINFRWSIQPLNASHCREVQTTVWCFNWIFKWIYGLRFNCFHLYSWNLFDWLHVIWYFGPIHLFSFKLLSTLTLPLTLPVLSEHLFSSSYCSFLSYTTYWHCFPCLQFNWYHLLQVNDITSEQHCSIKAIKWNIYEHLCRYEQPIRWCYTSVSVSSSAIGPN